MAPEGVPSHTVPRARARRGAARAARIAVLALLAALAAVPARAEIAVVLNSGEDTVSLIDMASYREVKRFAIGKEPHHLMATPDDRYLIVANAMSNDLVYLDPRTGLIKRRVSRISDPYQIGFSPDQKWFVANSLRLDRVDVYRHSDGALALADRLTLGRAPSHLAFSPDSRTVFVTLQDENRLTAVSLEDRRTRWSQPTGSQPAGAWTTPDGRRVLVGLTGEDAVEVRDSGTGALVKRLTTGKGAHNFLAVGDGRHLLVSNRVADTVSVIDQARLEVVESFAVPGGPDCMELTRDGRQLWVTSRWINRVTVIDMPTRKVARSIRVGRSPHGIYFASHAARQ
ncbi:MAG TPA: beta-propeller fold lactonase family protein [Anaeromyxobacteraceae bacterium]|nr:beta-propeller fold lactonase family protein [Anaeromyxobacteraceae bacterium]